MPNINKNTKEELAIAYASIMRQYFHLVRMVLGETVKQGNNWVITSSDESTAWNEYENRTTWSDFQLILPVFFSLYHGLELSMKAILVINNQKLKGHKLNKIYSRVKVITDLPTGISSCLSKYIEPEVDSGILSNFMNANKCSIDEYYDFLKYPTDKSFETLRNYLPVKYQQEYALENFTEIVNDLHDLTKAVQVYIKSKLPEHYLE